MHITSLSHSGCINLAHLSNVTDLWYFVIKTTSGVFKITEPSLCRIMPVKTVSSRRVVFQYQSKKGNWLSKKHYAFKNNAYYFASKSEAELAFKEMVEGAKIHFKKQIVDANTALNILNNY